jgi:hypothetical protein
MGVMAIDPIDLIDLESILKRSLSDSLSPLLDELKELNRTMDNVLSALHEIASNTMSIEDRDDEDEFLEP